jgi:hypothetical protein
MHDRFGYAISRMQAAGDRRIIAEQQPLRAARRSIWTIRWCVRSSPTVERRALARRRCAAWRWRGLGTRDGNDAEAPAIDLARQPARRSPRSTASRCWRCRRTCIRPEALEIFLELQGPLDLLLYLIRVSNINVLDIDGGV